MFKCDSENRPVNTYIEFGVSNFERKKKKKYFRFKRFDTRKKAKFESKRLAKFVFCVLIIFGNLVVRVNRKNKLAKMSGHQDLSTNIENSRNCLRRIARNDGQEFSRESIVNLMEKFVKTVNVMDETILVPCRLMDRSVGDSSDTIRDVPKATSTPHTKRKRTSVHENLNSAELFNLYNMLNGVKTDLLWGRNSEEQPEETAADEKSITKTDSSQSIVSDASKQQQKGHVRRPSTASVASSNSSSTNTLSDTESDISNENDSGIESESNNNHEQDKSTELAKQYRTHLLGLYRCLEQMTEAANYLTTRYQSDVGPV